MLISLLLLAQQQSPLFVNRCPIFYSNTKFSFAIAQKLITGGNYVVYTYFQDPHRDVHAINILLWVVFRNLSEQWSPLWAKWALATYQV